jgi:hypothetical protein
MAKRKYGLFYTLQEWYFDWQFSRNFRECRKISKQLELHREALRTTAVNEYTEGFVKFLGRRIDALVEKQIKADQRYNKIVAHFRK